MNTGDPDNTRKAQLLSGVSSTQFPPCEGRKQVRKKLLCTIYSSHISIIQPAWKANVQEDRGHWKRPCFAQPCQISPNFERSLTLFQLPPKCLKITLSCQCWNQAVPVLLRMTRSSSKPRWLTSKQDGKTTHPLRTARAGHTREESINVMRGDGMGPRSWGVPFPDTAASAMQCQMELVCRSQMWMWHLDGQVNMYISTLPFSLSCSMYIKQPARWVTEWIGTLVKSCRKKAWRWGVNHRSLTMHETGQSWVRPILSHSC